MIRGMRRPSRSDDAVRVQGLLRNLFDLPDHAAIVVSELQCAVPGCPPVETVALFWDAAGLGYRWRVFKPLAGVCAEDLPPKWYLPALLDDGGGDCGCC